jgi:pyruvate formate lyase activating enzyme
MNIDVKGFTERYYRDICKGLLEPVKRTVEIASKECHVEITTLVVTDLNDSIEEIGETSRWLSSIDKDIPLHLSRYFPNYKLSNEPTPLSTLAAAGEEAKKYLNYVYVGNIRGFDNTTFCPGCKRPVIMREEDIDTSGVVKGCCKYCGHKIAGTF